MQLLNDGITPISPVSHPLLIARNIRLLVKREDLIHSQISGNKWHKLKYNILQARGQGYSRLLSFGGAYSNHLHALAYTGAMLGMKTLGIVRGELAQPLNPTLRDASRWGMSFISVSRTHYKRRNEPGFLRHLIEDIHRWYVIPEGGANALSLKGCAELARDIARQVPDFDVLCVPCGTGTTLAGLVQGLPVGKQVLGFAALKAEGAIPRDVENLLSSSASATNCEWRIVEDFHAGGFAKVDEPLLRFMDEWKAYSDIPIEPLYTAKMLHGIFKLIEQGDFTDGSTLVALHTGGLQGLRGMQPRLDKIRARMANALAR